MLLFDTGFIYLTMIVDLTAIEGSSLPFEFVVTPAEIDVDEGSIRLTSDLHAVGDVVKHAAQIDVRGSINGDAEIECTRCLKAVPQKLAIEFAVSFVTPEDFAPSNEHEVLVDDLDTDVLADEQLDLKDVVREQVLLNLPEQALCKEDCRGLCAKCGSDLNLIDCNCGEDETDPRWAALKDLRF